MILQHLICS